MIPKVIHYCWFGGQPLPESALKCIESWRRFCPDYEIKQWSEKNYDVNKIQYTKEAYEKKRYAFVTDVARLDIIYSEGGIYLDTDVELIKP
ncbi:glycosyltransferase family 32 protein, partial [Streptomyces olivaceoviridis]